MNVSQYAIISNMAIQLAPSFVESLPCCICLQGLFSCEHVVMVPNLQMANVYVQIIPAEFFYHYTWIINPGKWLVMLLFFI